ncbi:MAG: VIT domain-containing protein [Chitinophagales bacterium]
MKTPIPILTAILLTLFTTFNSYAGGLMIATHKTDGWTIPRDFPPRHPIDPIRPPVRFNPFPLEVKSEKVEIDIEGQAAATHIDQIFYNPDNRRLEGYFLFPIPKGATLSDFSMFINGKETQAELLDASKARKIYEDIVRQLRDPALLEYSQQGLFKVRIFPIEPRSETRIKISYTQILEQDAGTLEYIYPLDTKKYSAKALQNLSLVANIKADQDLKTIYSPTHEVEIIRKGAKQVKVGFEASKVKPDVDFKLYFNTDNKAIGASLLSFKPRKKDGFFLLTLNPGVAEQEQEIAEKDITFVLDVSGSMSGEKLEKAKESLLFCVNNLNKGDHFNIVRFSTEARGLFDDLQEASKGNILEAREFIDDLKAVGGTNIDEALEKALSAKSRKDRPYMVVFITDGKPTIGVTEEAELIKKLTTNNTTNTRIFTFGIGENINTHLLDKITEHTKAFRSYILPDEDIEVKISNFYTKVSSPVLTDLKLNFSRNVSVFQTYPKDLPDLFKGSSTTVLGRYDNKGSDNVSVMLSGKVNGESKSFKYNASLSNDRHEDHDFIPPLWASRAVGYLLDQIRLHGEDKELVEEVVALAKEYGIVTPYTSYLILEDEEMRRRNIGRASPRPVEQPSFWQKNSNMDIAEEEYGAMKRKDGAGSVRSSREIQSLNKASNISHTKQGQYRMNNYATEEDSPIDIAQQYRNIQGRAVYQNQANSWTDSEVLSPKNQNAKRQRIAFASEEYFDLLQNEPAVSEFLSLGNNVEFYWEGEIIEVYE